VPPETGGAGTGEEGRGRRAVLELSVRNHPGVMSHVCGLFARRAYNLEGILCLPAPGSSTSRMWLLVEEDGRLSQVEKQIGKLVDVLSIRRHGAEHDAFARAREMFAG
jgi:acetolactate synthase-1/3 small subunit